MPGQDALAQHRPAPAPPRPTPRRGGTAGRARPGAAARAAPAASSPGGRPLRQRQVAAHPAEGGRREGGPSPVRGPSAAAQRRHYRPATDTERRRRRLIGNSRENRPTADLPSMAPSRRAPSAPAAILGAARPPFPPSAAGEPRSPSSGCWCKARTWQC
ncbi:brain acid soluble protein 1-like [Vidua chalybeata]|uniref:brain acid soluble protein 1-like n=1 Tax=Vidua chalybeata TaxID=81927 RepID=UPI0023A7DE15|nr:brain acid soluble protein 1-like [Vidua chalybeata]